MVEEVLIKPETDAAIQHLLHSPRLPLVVKQLEVILEAEQEKRQQFYAELSEEQKVEFVNGEVIVQTPAKWKCFPHPQKWSIGG
jgi:hypothetical protein